MTPQVVLRRLAQDRVRGHVLPKPLAAPDADKVEAIQPLLCPSYPDGAGLGVFAFVGDASTIFLDAITSHDDASRLGIPGQPRAAGICIRSRCIHWVEGCQLGIALSQWADGGQRAAPSACAVQPRCRWYAENGEQACMSCPQLTRVMAGDEG